MTISVTNIGTGSAKASTTGVSVSVPAGGVPAGALIYVGLTWSAAVSATVSDTAGNTYTAQQFTTGLNNNGANGSSAFFYAFNCLALVSGNTISISTAGTSSTFAVTALYATGIQTSSDPLDSSASAGVGGSSTTPSVTGGTPAVAGSLCIGIVGTNGPSGDTFTQDSGHGGWSTPPTRVGTTGGGATTNWTIAGGNQISSTAPTYAPTLGTSRTWADVVAVFKPPSDVLAAQACF